MSSYHCDNCGQDIVTQGGLCLACSHERITSLNTELAASREECTKLRCAVDWDFDATVFDAWNNHLARYKAVFEAFYKLYNSNEYADGAQHGDEYCSGYSDALGAIDDIYREHGIEVG